MSYSGKLFGTIPYEIRKPNEPYLSVEKAEEALKHSFFDDYEMETPTIPEIKSVFNNNRDNYYNLHVTVYKGSKYPKKNVWIDMPETEYSGIDISYEESSEQFNIVKSTCQKLGMTYKELGEAIGYSESAISNASRGNVSEQLGKAIDLYKEILKLKNQLDSTDRLKKALKELLS